MSCARHNGEGCDRSPAGEAGLRMDAPDRFHADLLNGLHALAQPLSVLRAASEAMTLLGKQGIDQGRYVAEFCAQAERACELFTSVQNLVATTLTEAGRARFDLWELLAPVIDDQRVLLESSGVGLAVANQAQWVPICGDAQRTARALAAVMKMAGAVASRGDVIELHASRDPGFLQLCFQNTRRHGKKMSSTDRLTLSLAAASITSQNGTYAFAEDPFCFSLALPLDDHGSGEYRTATCADRTH